MRWIRDLTVREMSNLEKLTNYKYTLSIEHIISVSGGDQRFEILFLSKADGCRYKLVFDSVLDMRYSIENGYIERFCEFRKNLPENTVDNSLYVVEDSEYVRFFHEQSSHTREGESLTDYIICDEIDTVLELLSNEEPALIRLSPIEVSRIKVYSEYKSIARYKDGYRDRGLIFSHENAKLSELDELISVLEPAFDKNGCAVSTGLFWRTSGTQVNLSARPDIADGYECYVYCIVQKNGKDVKIKSPDGENEIEGLSFGWKITSVCGKNSSLSVSLYDLDGAYGDVCELLRLLQES